MNEVKLVIHWTLHTLEVEWIFPCIQTECFNKMFFVKEAEAEAMFWH